MRRVWHDDQTNITCDIIAVRDWAGCFFYSSIEGGAEPKMTVTWTSKLVRIEELHKKWLCGVAREGEIKIYHPKIAGFESGLKLLR